MHVRQRRPSHSQNCVRVLQSVGARLAPVMWQTLNQYAVQVDPYLWISETKVGSFLFRQNFTPLMEGIRLFSPEWEYPAYVWVCEFRKESLNIRVSFIDDVLEGANMSVFGELLISFSANNNEIMVQVIQDLLDLPHLQFEWTFNGFILPLASIENL